MKPYNVWLDDEDKRRIREVQELYNCESQSQAVRTALKVAAQSGKVSGLVLPKASKHSKTKRKTKAVDAVEALLNIAQYAKVLAEEIPALPADFSARPDFYTYGEYWRQADGKNSD
jgi:predicted secreted hydrolase